MYPFLIFLAADDQNAKILYGVIGTLGAVALIAVVIVVIILLKKRRNNTAGTSQRATGLTNEECLRVCKQEERGNNTMALQERALSNRPYDVPRREEKQDKSTSDSKQYYIIPTASQDRALPNRPCEVPRLEQKQDESTSDSDQHYILPTASQNQALPNSPYEVLRREQNQDENTSDLNAYYFLSLAPPTDEYDEHYEEIPVQLSKEARV